MTDKPKGLLESLAEALVQADADHPPHPLTGKRVTVETENGAVFENVTLSHYYGGNRAVVTDDGGTVIRIGGVATVTEVEPPPNPLAGYSTEYLKQELEVYADWMSESGRVMANAEDEYRELMERLRADYKKHKTAWHDIYAGLKRRGQVP